MPALVSAAGVLALLNDEEPELQVFALKELNKDIDVVWMEVAACVAQIEALYENESFPERQLAALVLSKTYFHLQAYHESMTFALAAGDLFKLDNPGEYEETIISKCVDQYIAISSAAHHSSAKPEPTQHHHPHHHNHHHHHHTSSSGAGQEGAAASLASPTTPFSQSTLPSKSLLSRESTDNTMLDPAFLGAVPRKGRSSSIAHLPDPNTRAALQRAIDRLFEACLHQGHYRQVLGIAIEAKNLPMIRHVIKRASEDDKTKQPKSKPAHNVLTDSPASAADELMEYVLGVCMDVVEERSLRTEILRLILDLLNDAENPNPDYFAIARCVVYLNSDDEATRMLKTLVERAVEDNDLTTVATAYQIAFDMHDNGTQEFLGKVIKALPRETVPKKKNNAAEPSAEDALMADQDNNNDDDDDEYSEEIPNSEKMQKMYEKIRSILDGSKTIELNLEFLYRNNRTDLSILNKVRDSLEARSSIFHTAVTFCNAFMNQGTTNDKFFRDNLEWLGKATNWTKFSATVALGVIHRGNLSESRKLLDPYLPRSNNLSSGSIYSQGGALYAYGLIHANHGADALDYLRSQFSEASDEVILHGGALGLGIAGMATGSEDIFESLQKVLFSDSALNGEAVGLSMGLIMLGTGNEKSIEEMLTYAHETSHEKIVRGLALGMALIMYSRQELADGLIETLLQDTDPTIRYGGIMTVALAYCGTGSSKAIRKLLHFAVSDVNDDVRRVAVMSLGFILFRKPKSVPRMVELLSESYNPHVRYGSAMALGISCAGTGLDEAIDLLEPMIKDPTDFVRQGALISLATIMIQQNETMNPKSATIRNTLRRVIGDRHEDAMTKFGAAVALGIIDAGGRNCTIGLQTQTGNLNMAGIVGMAIFTQHWYWFPFTHFLALSFTPTSIIALDHDLEIPKVQFYCGSRPSLFDYPPEQEVKAEEEIKPLATAVLSTTAQAKRRAQKKERARRAESVDSTAPSGSSKIWTDKHKKSSDAAASATATATATATAAAKKPGDVMTSPAREETPAPTADGKKKPEKEKVGYMLDNLSRVLPGQLKYISLPQGRYKPVKKPSGGPVLLIDNEPRKMKHLVMEKLAVVKYEQQLTQMTQTLYPESGPSNTSEGITTSSSSHTPFQGATRSQQSNGGGVRDNIIGSRLIEFDPDRRAEEAPLPKQFAYVADDDDEDEEDEEEEEDEEL